MRRRAATRPAGSATRASTTGPSIRSSAWPTATPSRASTRPSTSGYAINTENNDTSYKSGNILHVDASVQQIFPLGSGFANIGAEAWYFQQVTCDSGSGATLGCFKGRTAGIGPVLGYIQPIGKAEAALRAQVAAGAGHEESPERRLHLAEDGLHVLMTASRRSFCKIDATNRLPRQPARARLTTTSCQQPAMEVGPRRALLQQPVLSAHWLFATTASAQEILPFPPTPSASKAGLTIETSTYKKRVEPKRLGGRRAEHPDHPDGRRRAGHALDLRRRDQYADARSRGEDGRLLQPLPLHRHVLAHAGLAAHRAQSHLCRQWPDRGDRQRLRRLQRDHPEVVGDGRRSAQELRLQHRRLGQVAQHARGADHQQGAVRLLADRLWLRVFLRLPGRRGFAVRADADAQHHRRSSSIPRRATTSPRTSPRTPSSGCASRRPTRRTSRSSCTGRRAHRTARTRS